MQEELTLAAAAVWYGSHGIPVFPCKRDKTPRTRRGFKDATTDEARIAEWWNKWPDANIGVPTGPASGLLAVDIDPRNGGDDSLDELLAKHGRFPETAEQMTGGGGRHILFRHPGVAVPKVLAPGIDLKGDGGYIVVAPSIHQSGNRYQWDGLEGSKALLTPAACPGWLLETIRNASAAARQQQSRKSAQPPSGGEKWRTGERNNRLTSFAGALRRWGVTPSAMEAALLEENRQRCAPPLGASEVRRIAASVARYPSGAAAPTSNPGGYIPPGYASALDALLDVVRFAADFPEFPVLLFHVERSLGFGKPSDCTSISQMVDGVFSKRLNTWIRRGCGLGKAAVVRANKALARPDREFLIVRRHHSPENGNEPTEYQVNWERLSRYIAEKRQQPLPALVSQGDKPLVSQRYTHNHYQERSTGNVMPQIEASLRVSSQSNRPRRRPKSLQSAFGRLRSTMHRERQAARRVSTCLRHLEA
jgi:hypothetical protein